MVVLVVIPLLKIKLQLSTGYAVLLKLEVDGNDTLLFTGNCNDELTGGKGADKFTCSEGNDTIKDYDSGEGDVILDQQNCEKIL